MDYHPPQPQPRTHPVGFWELKFLNLKSYAVNLSCIFKRERTKICFIMYKLHILKNLSDSWLKRVDIAQTLSNFCIDLIFIIVQVFLSVFIIQFIILGYSVIQLIEQQQERKMEQVRCEALPSFLMFSLNLWC